MSETNLGQAKGEAAHPLGLYVHVPFCASTCDFCAFYQIEPTAAKVGKFLDGAVRELALAGLGRTSTTVFWGGGTPGLLSPVDLRHLGFAIRNALPPGGAEEFTVELAPASVTAARLEALREIGVSRVSMGIQTFEPGLLEALGRQHTVAQIERAYSLARTAGFRSVNVDLMFALPGQSEEARAEDVRRAVALGPDHISTYCLTLEEDTALWLRMSRGRVKPDTAREASLYESTWAQLAGAGYAQYEVSNFARPGHACVHNVNTWKMHEWVGIGPSAASQHCGIRGANFADLDLWHDGVVRGERLGAERIQLTPALLAEDALLFGLRMNAGVDTAPWRARCPDAPWIAVDALLVRLAEEGLAVLEGTLVKLTQRGRLLADSVGGEVMEAFDTQPTLA